MRDALSLLDECIAFHPNEDITYEQVLKALGAEVTELEDGLVIQGAKALAGGTVDACNDHRIAMAAVILASFADSKTIIDGINCVNKYY